jgi:hypothetical protein
MVDVLLRSSLAANERLSSRRLIHEKAAIRKRQLGFPGTTN